MAKYEIQAPDKQFITVATGYQTLTLKHGDISYDDKLALIFPQIFKRIPETTYEKIVVEPIADVVSTAKEFEAVVEEVAAEVGEKVEEVIDEIVEVAEKVEEKVEEVVEKAVDKVKATVGKKGKK